MKRLAKIRKCKETLGNKQSINRPNYLGIITGPSRCNSTNEKNVREGDREREPKKKELQEDDNGPVRDSCNYNYMLFIDDGDQ